MQAMQTVPLRPTRAIISYQNLSNNLKIVKSLAPQSKVMTMVKANAYGHGLIPVAKHFLSQGADSLGVAFIEEAIELRKSGVTQPILVTGGILDDQIAPFIDFDLDITVSSIYKLRKTEEAAEQRKKKARVHLKIDTGMERIGVHYYNSAKLIEAALSSGNIEIIGVYSHLACADDPNSEMTKLQLERFLESTEHFNKISAPMPLRHIANSAAIINNQSTHLDIVRPGIMLYGSDPFDRKLGEINLKPAMKLVSKVCYFKVIEQGASVSYGATWKADQQTRIVTIPTGYGDGIRRDLSNKGEVLIRGQRYKIVGRICMDQFMVNINRDEAYVGDDVVIFGEDGKEKISVDDVAKKCNTISYEILTGLNTRIPREYL